MTQENLIVRFDDVSVIFGEKTAPALEMANQGMSRTDIQNKTGNILGVSKCSLDVHEGEIIVLMGLSGSGKSTLLRTVNRLNPITSGNVQIRTQGELIDVGMASNAALRALRQHTVTMVFQNFALLPWRTVAENVGLGLELGGMSPAKCKELVDLQLEIVGLGDWGDKQIHELSGGMQQRVGLARAFVTDAPVLLMDEPFSALDPLIRAHLQDELLTLQERLRRTIIFVSHDLDEAVKIGTKIAIMEGGRVVQFGTPQDIVLNPADDYVGEFVAHMNPLNVLRASDVMRVLNETRQPTASVPSVTPNTPLRSIIRQQADSIDVIEVIADGKAIGEIAAQDIMKSLIHS